MANLLNGWIRLWIVLTTMWISSVAYLAHPGIAEISERAKYEIKRDGIGTFLAVFSRGQPEEDVKRQIAEELIPFFEANAAQYNGKTYDKPYHDFAAANRSKRISHALSLAVAPPLVLLALGWAFAWVRRGFLQPPHRSADVNTHSSPGR